PKSIGALGIVLGILAFWLAAPPIQARSLTWPLVVGILAALCGIFAATRGALKVGWGAVAAAIIGVGLAELATRSSETNLNQIWNASLIAQMLVFATPLTFAAVGGMFSERSGVVNIGLEGMMLMGAFWGIWGADKTGSWWTGVLIAMLAGGTMAFIHAVWAIHLRADQIVGGTAINFLALGITGYAFIDIYGSRGTPDLSGPQSIPDTNLHLGGIPGIGGFLETAVGGLNLMTWLMLGL